MHRKKIVFMGGKSVGLECLKHLSEQQNNLHYDIVGVLTKYSNLNIIEYCKKNKIVLLRNLKECLKLSRVDIGISVQYHRILKKIHINKFKDIAVNLHMAPLPEYRGCNQFSHAIINEDTKFGTTLHQLEEGIDSGAIIFEKRFKIKKNIWVEELYKHTVRKSIVLFKEALPKLLKNNYKLKPQSLFYSERKSNYYNRDSIEQIKNINLSWGPDKISKHVRATLMSGFKPPYFNIGKTEIYLEKR